MKKAVSPTLLAPPRPATASTQPPTSVYSPITPESPKSKPQEERPSRRELLDHTSDQMTLLLEGFLDKPHAHLMQGLTQQMRVEARQLEVGKFQPVELLEQRLVQKWRMRSFADNYFLSIRRDLWAEFRKVRKRFGTEVFSEGFLRRVLLREEDFNHEIMPYATALRQFKKVMKAEFGGKIPRRTHAKWYRQFHSLPSFFPLEDVSDLMKNVQATEGETFT
ncbi:hypothetical protein BV898_05142 [Hypsibius exemplaris]|uniref:Uncharacterized protein n=1 Tax=Hypsibius exemplaris TaxID=2072580 RepID=A0A1W0WZZ7_HYPEX|nr:hypothetical protein BV898_05142 [Hypsibius exemplaris]